MAVGACLLVGVRVCLFLVVAVVPAAQTKATTNTTLLARWNFNGPNGPVSPPVPAVDNQASGSFTSSFPTVFYIPVPGSSLLNAYDTDVAGNCLAIISNTLVNGMWIQFQLDTRGYQSIRFTMAVLTTPGGFTTWSVQTETSSGQFAEVETVTQLTTNSDLVLTTLNLENEQSLWNSASAKVRIVLNGATSTSATMIDNLQVLGVLLPPSPSASPSLTASPSVTPSTTVSPSATPSTTVSPSSTVTPSTSTSASPSPSTSPSATTSVSASPSRSGSPSPSPSTSASASPSTSGSEPTLLARWNFNANVSSVTFPLLSVNNEASGKITSDFTGVAYDDGTLVNAYGDDLPGNDLMLFGDSNNGRWFQIELDTRGHKFIMITMAARISTMGHLKWNVQTEATPGDFTPIMDLRLPNDGQFAVVKLNLTSEQSLWNTESAKVRVHLGGAVSSTGNVRIDNLQVLSGSLVADPPSPTVTPSVSASSTASRTPTTTRSATTTPTVSSTPTSTRTPTRSATPTPTKSATRTPTASRTPTSSPTPTSSATRTPTTSVSATQTRSATRTPSASSSLSRTPTPTRSATRTPKAAPSATRTPRFRNPRVVTTDSSTT